MLYSKEEYFDNFLDKQCEQYVFWCDTASNFMYSSLLYGLDRDGMRFQKNTTEEQFSKSFGLVHVYSELKDSVRQELGLSLDSKNDFEQPDYEGNIEDMRMCMRRNEYLSKPHEENGVQALNGEKLDDELLNVINIAKEVKKNNVIQIIKKNDFFTKLDSMKIDVFQSVSFEADKDQQIKVLIGAIEEDEEREKMYYYFMEMKQKKSFNADSFLEDLLHSKYTFKI